MPNYALFVRKFKDQYAKDKKYHKVRGYCHCTCECRDAAHNICNLKYSVLKKIITIFHNGSNYDYHFITTELAEQFEG